MFANIGSLSYLSNRKLKPFDLKKLIFLLLASFIFTSSQAQFFKRKEKPANDKPRTEVKESNENDEEMKARIRAQIEQKKQEEQVAKEMAAEQKKAEKEAKEAEKKEKKMEKEAKSFSLKKLSDKEKMEPPLQDVKWVLLDIAGKPLNTGSENTPYLIMYSKGSKLEGSTGCNSIGGSYKKGRHDDISFQGITTKMACSDMKAEKLMQDALNRTNLYMLNGQNLLLYNDNLLLAIFEARFEE